MRKKSVGLQEPIMRYNIKNVPPSPFYHFAAVNIAALKKQNKKLIMPAKHNSGKQVSPG